MYALSVHNCQALPQASAVYKTRLACRWFSQHGCMPRPCPPGSGSKEVPRSCASRRHGWVECNVSLLEHKASSWATHPFSTAATGAQPPEPATGAAASPAAPQQTEPRHSVDTLDDVGGSSYEGADAADLPLCPPDSPLCEDPSHSLDNTDIMEWADSPNQGWADKGTTPAKAYMSSRCRTSRNSKPCWGGTVQPSLVVPGTGPTACSNAGTMRAVAAAAGGSTGSSGQQQRQQRRQLEQLLLSMVVHGDPGRHRGAVDSSYVVNIDDAPADEDVTGYEGADAVRLLYPQLDPARSYDEYDVIDWSDVPNDGWGGSSSSSNGTAPRCCGPTAHTSSSSTAAAHLWGSSLHASTVLPHRCAWSSSRVQRRAVAAYATAGHVGSTAAGSDPRHSVDTLDDVGGSSYEGADAADLPLCPPDSPLCEDPSHSLDNTDIMEWADSPNQGWADKADTKTGHDKHGQAGSSSSRMAPGSASMHLQAAPSHHPQLSPAGKLVKEQRPYMNIVNGRWVAPSKEQSERMMRQSYDMGPDEGV